MRPSHIGEYETKMRTLLTKDTIKASLTVLLGDGNAGVTDRGLQEIK